MSLISYNLKSHLAINMIFLISFGITHESSQGDECWHSGVHSQGHSRAPLLPRGSGPDGEAFVPYCLTAAPTVSSSSLLFPSLLLSQMQSRQAQRGL